MPQRKAGMKNPDRNSLRFLESTAEVAFASDERNRIVVWNHAAERYLGHEADQVVGKRCEEVLRGTDLFGNRFCSKSCPLQIMNRRDEPIHAFQFQVQTASAEKRTVKCNIVVVPGSRPGGHSMIHMLVPATQGSVMGVTEGSPRACAPAASGPAPAAGKEPASGCPRDLTRREVQILRLIAAGTDTGQIARLLSLSIFTVRNHIQHILYKLEVHTKLQAIFVARREEMI